jgi:uncharacterized protein
LPGDIPLKFLVLMLTSRCNLHCSYCYAGAGPKGQDMSLQTALEALERFAPPEGKLTVELAGGEPLLAFDLVQEIIARTSQNQRVRFALQTNGLLLDEKKALFLAQSGVGMGLSLDGIPEINNLNRSAGIETVKALNLLSDLNLGTNLTVVLTRDNIEHLPKFVLFCANQPCIRVINFDLIRPLGRARDKDLVPESKQVTGMIPRLLEALAFVNGRRFPPLKIREVDQVRRRKNQKHLRPYCYAAQGLAAAVTPEGQIYSCASLAGQEEFYAGTVQEPRPDDLKAMASKCRLPEACADCPAVSFCRGGCPSRRVAFSGRCDQRSDLDCLLHTELFRRLT